jgi:hypothetical protein
MKDFNQEIEQLAKKFKKPPIFDGVVNEEKYQNSAIKIMWVLKDANSTGEVESYDLRDAINNLKTDYGIRKGWEKTFSNIIYVTNGILNQKEWDDIPFPKNEPEIVDILKQIAYVNIKKVGGGSQSVESELQEHFEKSKKLLLDQIEEFNPDVIIFGNTYRFFKNDLGLNQMNIFGTCHATAKSDRIYIDAYHPNAKISGKDYFVDILKAYNIFKKQIDNIDKISYSNKSYKNDIKILKEKVFDSKEQSVKIKADLLKSQQYEKVALLKPIKENLEKVLDEIDKLDMK